jgi:hypothetical protein
MQAEKKAALRLTVLLIAVLAASCASMGQYMPMAEDETAIGTAQVSFEARDTRFTRRAISALAYIKLLEAARAQYSGNMEIRDILWAAGKESAPGFSEIAASGKVIRLAP